jgi:type IV pilus assembly protein PilQ
VIAQLDIAVRQVLIEARIVTASTNSSEQLGIRWGGGTSWNGDRYQAGGSTETVNEIRDGSVGGTSPGNLVVDLGAAGPATSFAIGITGESYLLDLELSALASEGSAEVVARPKLITADKSPAVIRWVPRCPIRRPRPAAPLRPRSRTRCCPCRSLPRSRRTTGSSWI